MHSVGLFVVLAMTASLPGQSPASYRVTRTVTLGGDGSWDYIVPDPPDHRVFVARQNRVGFDPVNHRVFIMSAKFGPVPAGGRRGPVLPGTFTLMTIEKH